MAALVMVVVVEVGLLSVVVGWETVVVSLVAAVMDLAGLVMVVVVEVGLLSVVVVWETVVVGWETVVVS